MNMGKTWTGRNLFSENTTLNIGYEYEETWTGRLCCRYFL